MNIYKKITRTVFISMTRKCNFECPSCYCALSDTAVPSKKNIRSCLRLLAEMPRLEAISLIGGEPLIHSSNLLAMLDGIKVINKQKKKKIRVTIYTNGSFYVDLREYREMLNPLVVALSGFGDTHDKLRYYKDTKKGSFRDIMFNMQLYRKAGIAFYFQYVVNQHSIGTLYDDIHAFRQNKFWIKDTYIVVQFDHFVVWQKHFLRIVKYFIDILRLNMYFKKECVLPHHLYQVECAKVCTAGTSFSGIDLYSGKIHGCYENNGGAIDIIGTIYTGCAATSIVKYMREKDLALYKYKSLTKFLSQLLFKIFGGKICPTRNYFSCKNKRIIPIYFLWIYMLIPLYHVGGVFFKIKKNQ